MNTISNLLHVLQKGEEMEEMAAAATDTFELLKFSFLKAAVAIKPFAQGFRDIMDGVSGATEAMSGFVGKILEIPAGIVGKAADLIGVEGFGQVPQISDGVISNGKAFKIDDIKLKY